MKRIASILLLLLFLFNITGYYFLFLIADSTNRNEMQAELFHEISSQTIRIHKSEIKNIIYKEGDKEISYNGEMYDVKDKTTDGDYFIFHCVNDKKETKLLAGLSNHVKQNSDSNVPEKKQNDKNPVKDLFFLQNTMAEVSSVLFEFPSAFCHFTSYISSTVSHPPEVSIS